MGDKDERSLYSFYLINFKYKSFYHQHGGYFKAFMRNINKYTTIVRREAFVKAIRNQQLSQIKAQKRRKLIDDNNILSILWEFKSSLENIYLFQQQNAIMKFLEFIQENSHSQIFCQQLKGMHIIQQFIHRIKMQFKTKHIFDAPFLIEKLFELIYYLLARSKIFLEIIQKQFNFFMFCLYRYANTKSIIEKVSQYFTSIQFLINSRNQWRQSYLIGKIIPQKEVMEKLLEIYILSDEYNIFEGNNEKIVSKSSSEWFKNGMKCLEVVNSIIQISFQSGHGQSIWQSAIIRQSLFEGLRVFLTEKQFVIQKLYFDSDSSSTNSFNEQEPEIVLSNVIESQYTNLYFISLLLDLILIKQGLLQQRQTSILKGILNNLLKQLDEYKIITLTIVKILKLFYEQVIFNDEDLIELSARYPVLEEMIESIIQNDIF